MVMAHIYVVRQKYPYNSLKCHTPAISAKEMGTLLFTPGIKTVFRFWVFSSEVFSSLLTKK